jgi:hypothetical protein
MYTYLKPNPGATGCGRAKPGGPEALEQQTHALLLCLLDLYYPPTPSSFQCTLTLHYHYTPAAFITPSYAKHNWPPSGFFAPHYGMILSS